MRRGRFNRINLKSVLQDHRRVASTGNHLRACCRLLRRGDHFVIWSPAQSHPHKQRCEDIDHAEFDGASHASNVPTSALCSAVQFWIETKIESSIASCGSRVAFLHFAVFLPHKIPFDCACFKHDAFRTGAIVHTRARRICPGNDVSRHVCRFITAQLPRFYQHIIVAIRCVYTP